MKYKIINKTNDKKWREYDFIYQQILDRVMQLFELNENYVVSIILCKSKYIHKINRDYRQKDSETDVITFASLEGEVYDFDEDKELGDIFINVDRVITQAKEYGHSNLRELGFLFTHGVLHCLGYDHMNEEDEKEMIALQKEILDGIVSREDN